MTDQPLLLSLEEAAELLGITPDELLRSRGRGLAPGSFGFKDQPGGPLIWKREDLEAPEPSPSASPISLEKEEEMAGMVKTIAANNNICDVCGRQFKTPGGLGSHKRTHEEEQ